MNLAVSDFSFPSRGPSGYFNNFDVSGLESYSEMALSASTLNGRLCGEETGCRGGGVGSPAIRLGIGAIFRSLEMDLQTVAITIDGIPRQTLSFRTSVATAFRPRPFKSRVQ